MWRSQCEWNEIILSSSVENYPESVLARHLMPLKTLSFWSILTLISRITHPFGFPLRYVLFYHHGQTAHSLFFSLSSAVFCILSSEFFPSLIHTLKGTYLLLRLQWLFICQSQTYISFGCTPISPAPYWIYFFEVGVI